MHAPLTPTQRDLMDAHKARQAKFYPRPKPDLLPAKAPEPVRPPTFDLARPVTDPCWIAIDGNMPLPEPEKARLKISDIKISVARYFGVSVLDLESARRTTNVVIPRQIAMYLARHLTPASFPEIGRRFGGRDHSTALHAWQKISKRIETDTALRSAIQSIHLARV